MIIIIFLGLFPHLQEGASLFARFCRNYCKSEAKKFYPHDRKRPVERGKLGFTDTTTVLSIDLLLKGENE